jgi:hypothetical protein
VPAEVASYLEALRSALEDLPQEEREDLLAEVEASLIDAAEEGERPIAARLGPPEEFAAELRASAGLHPQPAHRAGASATLAGLARQLADRLASDQRVARTRRLGRELAPIWWLARAYVAVAGVTLLTGGAWAASQQAVPRLGGAGTAALVLLAAAAASVALGLRSRRGGSTLRAAALWLNLLLVGLAVPVAIHVADGSAAPSYGPVAYAPVPEAPTPSGLVLDGNPVRNIYPYSRDGRRLLDVLLYDQDGRPLDIGRGEADPQRRLVVAGARRLLFNTFPIRYYEPGTRRVANPAAGPRVRVPDIRTPPLIPPRVRP